MFAIIKNRQGPARKGNTVTHVQYAEPTGAALLDRVVPWWELAINAKTLDLSSEKKCVLGRLFGSFKRGCDKLGITLEQAVAFGFHAPTHLSKRDADAYYAGLHPAWEHSIERRMPGII